MCSLALESMGWDYINHRTPELYWNIETLSPKMKRYNARINPTADNKTQLKSQHSIFMKAKLRRVGLNEMLCWSASARRAERL
jgi:hypothetical protein